MALFSAASVCLLGLLTFYPLLSASKGVELENHGNQVKDTSENISDDYADYTVNYMLYTRKHPDKFYLLQLENKLSISRSDFDPAKETKIIVHGWKKSFATSYSVSLKNAYLKKIDANLLLVDWSIQSHHNYIASRVDVKKVGEAVAHMIDLLVTEFGVNSSRVHMIGHSLGSHVAGIAGLRLRSGNISRITGLDPAGPLFSLKETDRLRPDSADFVDVMHTCGDVLGFKAPLGQVDFYPNGGTYQQPGCAFDPRGSCSHARSFKYFVESIKSNDFYGVQCSDWHSFKEQNCSLPAVPMGEYTPSWARGNYYLRTNSKSPYGRGEDIY